MTGDASLGNAHKCTSRNMSIGVQGKNGWEKRFFVLRYSIHLNPDVKKMVLAGGFGSFRLHVFHSFLFDCLDGLRCAVRLLVLQVALKEELDLLHRHA